MNDPFVRYLHRRLGRRHVLGLLGSAGTAAVLGACSSGSGSKGTAGSSGNEGDSSSKDSVARPAGWSEESHGGDVDPDYGVVFPANRVNEVAITISPDNWQRMLDDMTKLFGARGTGGGPGGTRPGAGRPDGGFPGGMRPGGEPPAGEVPGGMPPGAQGGGPGDFTAENPIWVPATIAFNGKTWTNVGVRFKGNSSLSSSWREGTDKMPLKLDFDEFEGDFPEIANQRFHGFKQFSLSNNFSDATFMRESTAYALLERADLVAAKTAPWFLTLDRGEGAEPLGIYTTIEVVDDTVIGRSFSDGSGNIYEGDGRGASLAEGTESLIESSFQIEGGSADWSDIKGLYAALHAPNRTTDAGAWRSKIESLFEVESFLEWLALAATLQHWDTYGGLTHNFYLYNNPSDGRLHWISWDHNEVLGNRAGGGAAPGAETPLGGAGAFPGGDARGIGGRANVSFDKSTVNSSWPLIRYLLDQPNYLSKYNGYLRDTIKLFDVSTLEASYRQRAEILRPHISADATDAEFDAAVQALVQATRGRADALKAYVESL